jgi:hypothetical protein
MRVTTTEGHFKVRAIAGTHTVLMALDCAEPRRHGLLGFGFKREIVGGPPTADKWLRSLKVFKSVVPNPRQPARFSTKDHPIQSFLWSDYTAEPDTRYRFTVVPMYGQPGALAPQPGLAFEVRTEKAFDQGHGVWFNRGAIASQAFAREFGNRAPTAQETDDPAAPINRWLARGLLEACLAFIHGTPAGDALRVAAYEFTYKPVLDALKAALDRGVDVRIVLLVDPLSNDPLVCSGSANFSPDSLLVNDENMLLIRGDTRVADIYLTEFDRIFRHFYFRDVANEIEARGGEAAGAFLDETSKWTDGYFAPGAFKTRRREMFFADPAKSWVASAAQR